MESVEASFRLDDFVVDSPIGQGAYGQIYKATEIRSGHVFALKALNRRCLIKIKKMNLPGIEKNALLKCACIFVIHLFGTFKDDSNLYFVFEFAEHGDLAEAIQEIGSLNIEVVRLISAQILWAICNIHKANIIHRDLKPENILLDSRNHVKITDFGTAMINNSSSADFNRSSIVGTPAFVAPELLNDGQICYSSDMWSYGCIIFNLLTGRAPFEGENQAELMQNISNLKFCSAIDKLPALAKDLILSLLKLDPKERLGYGENAQKYPTVRSHPFFEGIKWDTPSLIKMEMPIFSKFQEEEKQTMADAVLDKKANEKVIMEGEAERKRLLTWKRRHLYLTNRARLLVFNIDKGNNPVFKAEYKINKNVKVECNGTEWTLHYWDQKNMKEVFRCDDGQSGIWAATIMREFMAHKDDEVDE